MKDEICRVVGVLKFLVSRDLISSVKDVHAKYITDPDAEQERDKNEKKMEKEKKDKYISLKSWIWN